MRYQMAIWEISEESPREKKMSSNIFRERAPFLNRISTEKATENKYGIYTLTLSSVLFSSNKNSSVPSK